MRVCQAVPIAGIAIILAVLPVARAEEGAPASYQPCIACHGNAGQGNTDLRAPALAGQGEAYLARQMTHFKSGIRGSNEKDTLGAQMKAMVVPLSEDDISRLASYLSGLPTSAPEAVTGDLKNGNNLYQGNCGACHGGKAEGNPTLNAPGLAWLDANYLKLQYRNFQQGLRGTHPDDTYGRQMQIMANSLPTEKDLDDVIAYIHSLATE